MFEEIKLGYTKTRLFTEEDVQKIIKVVLYEASGCDYVIIKTGENAFLGHFSEYAAEQNDTLDSTGVVNALNKNISTDNCFETVVITVKGGKVYTLSKSVGRLMSKFEGCSLSNFTLVLKGYDLDGISSIKVGRADGTKAVFKRQLLSDKVSRPSDKYVCKGKEFPLQAMVELINTEGKKGSLTMLEFSTPEGILSLSKN